MSKESKKSPPPSAVETVESDGARSLSRAGTNADRPRRPQAGSESKRLWAEWAGRRAVQGAAGAVHMSGSIHRIPP